MADTTALSSASQGCPTDGVKFTPHGAAVSVRRRHRGIDRGSVAGLERGYMDVRTVREVSGTMKKLNGNNPVEHTGAYAIAELARSDRYTKVQLPREVILDEAKESIRQSRQLIAGRFLVVDAQEKVCEALYKPAGFRRLTIAQAPRSMPDGEFVTGCCLIKDW